MSLILRLRCWFNWICYEHAEPKAFDGYGGSYCRACVGARLRRYQVKQRQLRRQINRRRNMMRYWG